MHGNGFERTRSSPRVSPRVVRLLAGDALDMVAPLGSAMPIARVRRRAAVAPAEGESPGPLRTLPVTALAHAPGVAVLIRFTLPCAGTLDVGALSQRLAELTVPSALLDALVRALRVARMDRAGGRPAVGGVRRRGVRRTRARRGTRGGGARCAPRCARTRRRGLRAPRTRRSAGARGVERAASKRPCAPSAPCVADAGRGAGGVDGRRLGRGAPVSARARTRRCRARSRSSMPPPRSHRTPRRDTASTSPRPSTRSRSTSGRSSRCSTRRRCAPCC